MSREELEKVINLLGEAYGRMKNILSSLPEEEKKQIDNSKVNIARRKSI